MLDLCKLIMLGLVVLLPLANPLTSVALFLGLSGNMTLEERKQQALMASVYVFLIMVVSFYAGRGIMDTFGISIPGLRIAGGLIVAFIGFNMLFPKNIDDTLETDVVEHPQKAKNQNVAFIPLAMPSTAGPGTIAMIISSASSMHQLTHYPQWTLWIAPPLIFLLVAVILFMSLRSADFIMKLVGKHGIEAISRLMGFLLVCMGVQFIINGVHDLVYLA